MDRIFEKNLFSEIEEFFSSQGFTISYEEIETSKALVMETDSNEAFEDCSISVGDTDEGIADVNILFSLEVGLSEEDFEKVDDLLMYLNKYLTVGSFGLVKESGFIYFRCSYLADTQAEIEQAMTVFLMTWQIASETAAQGVQTVRSVINGEAQISELMNDDTSIIQFD